MFVLSSRAIWWGLNEIGRGDGVVQPEMIDPDTTGLDISRFWPLPRITEPFRFFWIARTVKER